MSQLWTDLIDPETLTDYVRTSVETRERAKGALAQFLPNKTVADTVVRFMKGASGLVEVAKFRAYDAAPEIGGGVKGERIVLELPAVGKELAVSEYDQLRIRNANDDQMLNQVLSTADSVATAVSDGMELLRGIVLDTGKATVSQDNFAMDDDFGRNPDHTVTASNLWTDASVSRIDDLIAWAELYTGTNGEAPGIMLMSSKAFRALRNSKEFATQLLNGGQRPASMDDVQSILVGEGLPRVQIYDRRVLKGGVKTRVIPETKVLFLPEPVDPYDAEASELGATYWGQTLTSTDPAYGITAGNEPGIVAGTYRNPKPPMIAEVVSDAIAMPVLGNADLSLTAKVL